MDELSQVVHDLAAYVSKRYSFLGPVISGIIIQHEEDVRIWLKKNKEKIQRILNELDENSKA